MAIIGVIVGSGLVTFFIDLIPDNGAKVAAFVVFGIVLGFCWTIMGIPVLFVGIALGAIVGACNGAIVAGIQSNLPRTTGILYALLKFAEWIIPTLLNTAIGSPLEFISE